MTPTTPTTDTDHPVSQGDRANGVVGPFAVEAGTTEAPEQMRATGVTEPGAAPSTQQSPGDDLERRCAAQARRITELERDFHALSHGIRSPLVALKGFAGLLEEELSDSAGDNGRHFLARIAEAGRRIESLLNDLAQLLAIHEQSPSRSWIDPAPLIESLAGEFKPALDEAGMRILMSQDPPLVYCDQAQLHLALKHLIGNALQHGSPSEPRHVQIRVERSDTETRLTVVDGGPGMDEALEARAFEPFDCAGDRLRRFDDGRESSGVGLTLVQRIAEVHGGCARIETAPGRGVSVIITFPHE